MNKSQTKFEKLTENLELTAPTVEIKEKILYIRMSEKNIEIIEEMQEHFSYKKRSDFIRALLEDVIKTYKKVKESD